jgi:hypothetical protein
MKVGTAGGSPLRSLCSDMPEAIENRLLRGYNYQAGHIVRINFYILAAANFPKATKLRDRICIHPNHRVVRKNADYDTERYRVSAR